MSCEKIPVVVGVTGHRDLYPEDIPALKEEVKKDLLKIKQMCGDTPVVMLNALAEGADMLCAEVAVEAGIPLYVVMPCEEKRYIESIEDAEAKVRFGCLISRAERVFVAPDTEQNYDWIKTQRDMKQTDYEYRQLGIYMAANSHILLALWNGKEPPESNPFGCGAAEVVSFALEQKYLSKDHLFKPGLLNDAAVCWIYTRRQKDKLDSAADPGIFTKWLHMEVVNVPKTVRVETAEPPVFLKDTIERTAEYNAAAPVSTDAVKLWANPEQLDDYRLGLRSHYIKADHLSYTVNQKPYNKFLLAIAFLGTLVALFFTLYDDASLTLMIFACTCALILLLTLVFLGNRKKYHKNFVEYRAMAEALRIQFYMSMGLSEQSRLYNVCTLYSWTQKSDMLWIAKAIQALGIICECNPGKISAIDKSKIIDVWLGISSKPTGQLKYHTSKLSANRAKSVFNSRLSRCISGVTVGIYFVIFALELATAIINATGNNWFWEGIMAGGVEWRSLGIIIVGTATAASLLFSSYFGKMSYDRKADDNFKMANLYASACERWKDVSFRPDAERDGFIKEVAREEIVENGIWVSYMLGNGLEVNI